MLEAVQRWANDDLRSLNAQIEFVLRDALRRAGRLPSDSPAEPRPSDSDDAVRPAAHHSQPSHHLAPDLVTLATSLVRTYRSIRNCR